MSIVEKVETYLDMTQQTYEVGQPEYYARVSLALALDSHKSRNMGVGVVLVYVRESDGIIYEFRDMAAKESRGLWFDHAEARTVTNFQIYEKTVFYGKPFVDYPPAKGPFTTYPRDLTKFTTELKPGLHVYGTLEPCPMCMVAIVSAGAHTSVASVKDDDGAMVLGEKLKQIPKFWTNWFEYIELTFSLIDTTDQDLLALSEQLFIESRRRCLS